MNANQRAALAHVELGLSAVECGVAAFVARITPEKAEELLRRNVVNRSPLKNRVREYAAQQGAGEWHLTGQPIIFDSEWNLLDGQHRLLACVSSGEEMCVMVVVGVDPSARPYIDGGKARTSGEVMQIEGIKNGKKIAACLSLVIGYDHGALTSKTMMRVHASRSAMLAFYGANAAAADAAVLAGENCYRSLRVTPAAWAATCFILSRIDSDRSAAFTSGVAEGVSLRHNDPRLALRNWFINRMQKHQTVTSGEALMSMVIAWNKWVSGKDAKLHKPWMRGQPQPIALYPMGGAQ